MKNERQLHTLVVKLILAYALGLIFLMQFSRTIDLNSQKTDDQKTTMEAGSISDHARRDALDEWLAELSRFECNGCGPFYRRLDSNDRYSYSCLQFQEQTFRETVGRYDPDLPEDLFWVLIYDCSYQMQLARALIEDKGAGAARYWHTSIYRRGLGEPPINKK